MAVDADDKVEIYRNWLELTKGTLTARFDKAGRMMDRRLNPDRTYKKPARWRTDAARRAATIRNVGHHMYTDAVRIDAQDVPEGIVDAAVTSLIAVHDLRGLHPLRNSRTGSIYIVKPKMHGPGRGRVHRRALCARGRFVVVAAQYAQARHHGRGAPHHRQPEGRDPCRCGPGGFHQYRSSTAPAMKSTRRSKPARWCARRPCAISRGLRRTRTGTWISGSPVGCVARRRSARECGRCRIVWPTC